MNADTDGDALDDGREVALGAGGGCPSPLVQDSDGDGIDDGTEVDVMGTSACSADTDGDSLPDGLDPTPLSPIMSNDVFVTILQQFAGLAQQLPLSSFAGQNNLVRAAHRFQVVNRFNLAAWLANAGHLQAAKFVLICLRSRIDSQPCPGDWMVSSPAKADMYEAVDLLIELLGG
jgi:hypothetical protein